MYYDISHGTKHPSTVLNIPLHSTHGIPMELNIPSTFIMIAPPPPPHDTEHPHSTEHPHGARSAFWGGGASRVPWG